MAGFGKLVIKGRYQLQDIINVLWYRSETPWNLGNSFEDLDNWVTNVWNTISEEWASAFPSTYVVESVEGTGYDNQGIPVTSSPVVHTVNLYGGVIVTPDTDGPAICCNLSFVLGQLHAIVGNYNFKRNRGYIAVGPIPSVWIGNDGGLADSYQSLLNAMAYVLMQPVQPAFSLTAFIPIRVHHAPLSYSPYSTAYSDIIGYRVPVSTSFRRSRSRSH